MLLMALSTFRRVASLTPWIPFKTREMVLVETPVRFATSLSLVFAITARNFQYYCFLWNSVSTVFW